MMKKDDCYAVYCSDCGKRIEAVERIGYYDFDDIKTKCRQCAESSNLGAYLSIPSIQRFLIGNVV
ncbi:MAG: hypothetical protein P8X96_17790 [Desulfobacteraceae bacterium]